MTRTRQRAAVKKFVDDNLPLPLGGSLGDATFLSREGTQTRDDDIASPRNEALSEI